MQCPVCHAEVDAGAKFCGSCGAPLDTASLYQAAPPVAPNAGTSYQAAPPVAPNANGGNYGAGYYPPVANPAPAPDDAPNIGFAILGFFIPLVGLILYLMWKDQTPLKAKSCGKGALIGVIVGVVFSCLIMILSVFLAASY